MWEEDGKQGWENCARSGDGNERRFAHDGNGDKRRTSGKTVPEVGMEMKDVLPTMGMGIIGKIQEFPY